MRMRMEGNENERNEEKISEWEEWKQRKRKWTGMKAGMRIWMKYIMHDKKYGDNIINREKID